ncbi:MAG: tripartite tricarboxylate transporter TctB family protein [Burkholderiales bacterium]|nr:tripartite tricarboxylate transporter TctB family protein [Burkholderiales bacterium]
MKLGKLWDNADFWAGVMFITFGVAAVFFSRDYPMGSAMRMGPGYFPHYLGILMTLFGVIIAAKGLFGERERIGKWAFRPLVVLGVGIILFGFAMDSFGFIPSLLILIVLSTLAGREFKLPEVILLTVVLVAGAVGVFIYGIGLPYQLFWWY